MNGPFTVLLNFYHLPSIIVPFGFIGGSVCRLQISADCHGKGLASARLGHGTPSELKFKALCEYGPLWPKSLDSLTYSLKDCETMTNRNVSSNTTLAMPLHLEVTGLTSSTIGRTVMNKFPAVV